MVMANTTFTGEFLYIIFFMWQVSFMTLSQLIVLFCMTCFTSI